MLTDGLHEFYMCFNRNMYIYENHFLSKTKFTIICMKHNMYILLFSLKDEIFFNKAQFNEKIITTFITFMYTLI